MTSESRHFRRSYVVTIYMWFKNDIQLESYCDSGLDSIESPGILTIIDGPEHDELSQVYSHLSPYHVGSHVPTLS